MQNYKIVDYIRISGIDKWFDTEIKCKLGLSIKTKIANRISTGNWAPIMGSCIDSDKPTFFCLRMPNTSTERVVFDYGSESQRLVNNTNTSPLGKVLEIEVKNGEIKVDGTSVTKTPYTTPYTLDRTFVIGNNINNSGYNTDCEYYYLQLFDGEDLVFDGIPCVDADGTPAFYDKVADKLIYVGGTSGTISNPKPHETFVYNVPKRADGKFACTVVPRHTTPLTFVYLNKASSSSLSIPFAWNTAKPNLRIRAKYKPKTAVNSGCSLGFANKGDNADFRFFAYSSTYAYFDLGSSRATVQKLGYNNGLKEIEIGNYYVKDLTDGSSLYSGSRVSTDCVSVTDGMAKVLIGYIYINYLQVLDENDNLLLDLIPKKDANGNNCLYDKLTDSYHGADWGMTWVKEGQVESSWNRCRSVDFGGADVSFQGQDRYTRPFANNTTITSVTNGTYANAYCNYMFSGCNKLVEFDLGLPKLKDGSYMFANATSLSAFTSELPSLTNGTAMFGYCTSLSSFTVDLPSLTTGNSMFAHCSSLTSFEKDLSGLTDGTAFIYDCPNLQTFSANMQSLVSYSNMFSGCTSLANVEMIVNASNSGWVQSDFNIPTSAPCNAFRYVDNLGDGTVRLVFTSQARPEPEPTTGWDVVVSKGTSAYDVQASSVLRDFSDCFAFDSHNQSLFDAYLSDYSYNTTKGYVIYVDNSSGNTGTMSDNIINLIGADSQYGMLIVYKDNATTHSYFHLSIDGVNHTVSVDGRKTLSLEGFTPTLRPLDIYSGLSGQIILPD